MKTMVIDTSTQVLFLSFLENDKIIYNLEFLGKNNHSENLIKQINQALAQLQLQVKDFARIIVGIGPGSYTGLRVGLTVAKMFSWTLQIPLYTCSSLDIIASGYFQNDGYYLIKTRAKRNYSYCKLVHIKNQKYQVVIDEQFISNDELGKLIKDEYQIIDETNYVYNPLNLKKIKEVTDIYLLEPNYLRGEL